MRTVMNGIIAGILLGIADVLLMMPLSFPDKKAALLGAFVNRFAIGFVVVNMDLPVPFWAKGIIVGLLLSLPDAIITKSYIPILSTGIVGGLLVSFFTK